MVHVVLSIAMLAIFALMYGAIRLGMRDGWGKRPLLMGLAALVILGNILIWAVPNEAGHSLLNEAQKTES